MKCTKCNNPYKIQPTEEYISLMCKCQAIIIYPDGFTIRKTKEEYLEHQKKNKKKR